MWSYVKPTTTKTIYAYDHVIYYKKQAICGYQLEVGADPAKVYFLLHSHAVISKNNITIFSNKGKPTDTIIRTIYIMCMCVDLSYANWNAKQ